MYMAAWCAGTRRSRSQPHSWAMTLHLIIGTNPPRLYLPSRPRRAAADKPHETRARAQPEPHLDAQPWEQIKAGKGPTCRGWKVGEATRGADLLRHTPTLLLPPPECTAAASEREGWCCAGSKIKNEGEEIMFRGGERRESR